MTDLSLKIDENAVRLIVSSKLSKAIEEELNELDIKNLIKKQLKQTTPSKKHDSYLRVMDMFYSTSASESHSCLLDRCIHDAISEHAKQFIAKKMRENAPFLDDALIQMMRGSEKRLTRAFCKSMLDAVENADFSFKLDMEVSIPSTEKESSDDD